MSKIKIIKSKKKIIQKLVQFSLNIIKERGFNEFLNIVFSQLEQLVIQIQESFAVSYIKNIKKSDQYKLWLSNNDLFSNNEELAGNLINKFNFTPSFNIIVHENNKTNFDNLISCLQKQLYKNWKIILFDLKDNNKSHIFTKPNIQKIKDFDEISNNPNFNIEYSVFIENDAILYPDTLLWIAKYLNEKKESEIIYSDEDQMIDDKRTNPFFKPDWSPNLFLNHDYFSKFFVIRNDLLSKIQFDKKIINHYDILLKATELTKKISHIPIPLISIKSNDDYKSELQENMEYLKNAIQRRMIKGTLVKTNNRNFRIKYQLDKEPKVSIIIPTKDNIRVLKRCIKSLKEKTNYKNWELIIIDNNSKNKETLDYLNNLPYEVLEFNENFNFSKMNNLAVQKTNGDFLLFMNDDVAAIDPTWLHELVSIGIQSNIGVVGPKLLFSDNTIQHAGMVFLPTGAGFHPFQRISSNGKSYHGLSNLLRDCSAVTGACLLIKKNIFDEVSGYDPDFDLYYGDSDLCLKVREKGYDVVYTPYTKLLHDGSTKTKEISDSFFAVENHRTFIQKWQFLKNGDPFYNPNLDWNYNVETEKEITKKPF
ncbi:MAG: glycosyltransferase family 2 protein [Nitrosopumilus sp.]|nr:glycosyltransferase family 2 protein [Nitrosopumilus sp.]MDH3488187.1 glycosyltransferase family 2 protein [Nitrosopumilus sp.]